MNKNFVIVSVPRCGTRLLSSCLNSIKGISCWNEMFRPDQQTRKHMIGYPDSPFTAAVDEYDVYNTILANGENKGLVAMFWNGTSLGTRKFELTDCLNPWPILCSDKCLRIIHLKRKNSFRRYISHILANGGETHNREKSAWHWDVGKKQPEQRTVFISRDLAIQNIKEAEKKHSAIDIIFQEHNKLNIYYEDLDNNLNNAIELVTGFLNHNNKEHSVSTNKIIQDYSNVVENWDEVKDLDICH